MIWITKLEANGNDFLLFDCEQQKSPVTENLRRSLVKLCDRHFGIGADGFIFLQNKSAKEWAWEFYNSDGSLAEMCGNACHCVGRYVLTTYNETEIELETLADRVKIIASSNEVSLQTLVKTMEPKRIDFVHHGLKSCSYIDTGVPHIVCEIEAVSSENLSHLPIEKLRILKGDGFDGANVTFFDHNLKTTTFERGVEDFTLACGTGVLAVALVVRSRSQSNQSLLIKNPGGQNRIEFGPGNNIKLVGSPNIVAACRISFSSQGDPL